MSVGDFLEQTLTGGDVTIAHPGAAPAVVDDALANTLMRFEDAARLDFPGTSPPFDARVAAWAARIVYGLSQCLVYRELDATFIAELTAEPCPSAMSPSTIYSADLCFRLLPDLHRLARAISDDDPLTLQFQTLSRGWPLSSVGVALDGEIDIAAFFEHDSLRRLYVDRIIERNDASRLGDPAVASAVKGALGTVSTLASPTIQLALGPAAKGV